MILDFWYSERCTRQIKLIICIMVCVAIHFSSVIQQLSPLFAGCSLALGVLIHVLRKWRLTLYKNNPNLQGLNILFTVLAIILLMLLINMLPSEQKLYLGIQSIGFVALGLFIVSLYQKRTKRYPN